MLMKMKIYMVCSEGNAEDEWRSLLVLYVVDVTSVIAAKGMCTAMGKWKLVM